MKTKTLIISLLLVLGIAILASAGTPKSTQCSAITKKGTQCTRMTTDKSGLCWQHLDISKKAKTPKDTLTGPKGGRYYIENGVKHYIKRNK
jgi:hypothetical protein